MQDDRYREVRLQLQRQQRVNKAQFYINHASHLKKCLIDSYSADQLLIIIYSMLLILLK